MGVRFSLVGKVLRSFSTVGLLSNELYLQIMERLSLEMDLNRQNEIKDFESATICDYCINWDFNCSRETDDFGSCFIGRKVLVEINKERGLKQQPTSGSTVPAQAQSTQTAEIKDL